METFYIVKDFFANNIFKGVFISVLVLILSKHFFKKINIGNAINILRCLIIFFALLNTIEYIITFCTKTFEETTIYSRVFGEYWMTYWFMIITNSIFPLLLFNKKLGKNLIFLLTVTLLMNTGWIIESFIIHISNFHKDFRETSTNLYFPYPREIAILLKGFSFGILLLLIGNLIKKKH